jgi:hypothetical protein
MSSIFLSALHDCMCSVAIFLLAVVVCSHMSRCLVLLSHKSVC